MHMWVYRYSIYDIAYVYIYIYICMCVIYSIICYDIMLFRSDNLRSCYIKGVTIHNSIFIYIETYAIVSHDIILSKYDCLRSTDTKYLTKHNV